MFRRRQYFQTPPRWLLTVIFATPLFFFPGVGFAQSATTPLPVVDDSTDPDEPDSPQLPPVPALAQPVAAPSESAPAAASAKSPVFSSAEKSADSGFNGLSWSLPPTPWRAQLFLSGYGNFPSQYGSSLSIGETFSANADSYVWQPWFLRLNGSMSLSQIDTEDVGVSTRSNSLSLGANGNFLPNTRNPLSLTASLGNSKSISRTENGNTSRAEFQTTALGGTKVFIPIDRSFTSTWNYNWMNTAGESGGGAQGGFHSNSQSLGVNITVPIMTEDPQSLNFNTNLSLTKTSEQVATQVGNLNAAHSIYLQDYVMTISSNLLADTNSVAKAGVESKNTVFNAYSGLDWVPSDDYPLTVGGGLGAFNATSETGDSQYSVTNVNGRFYARYPLDKYWSFDGRLDTVQLSSQGPTGGFDSSTYGLSASANWTGDGMRAKWADWNYSNSYGTGAGFFYTSTTFPDGSNASSSMSADLRLNQGIARTYATVGGAPVSLSIDEGYSTRAQGGSAGGLYHALTHNLSVNWTPSTNFVTKSFSATLNDGRSWGDTSDVYQALTGDASVQYFASAYSTLGGSARLMFSRSSGAFGGREMATGNAGARYTHSRFANVSGLNYSARYDVFIRDDPSQGNRSSGLEHWLSQTWSWRYGLLGWQADYTITKFGPALDQTVTLSVVRDFSGVL